MSGPKGTRMGVVDRVSPLNGMRVLNSEGFWLSEGCRLDRPEQGGESQVRFC